MIRIRRNRLILAWMLVYLLASCGKAPVVDRFVEIPDRAWAYDFQPAFEIHVTDTTQAYRVFFNLRHSDTYKYANIFFKIHVSMPEGKIHTTERMELKLAEPDGRWTGKGGGNIYTHQHLIYDGYRLPDTGRYRFLIEQNMRENPLKQIVAAGLRIEEIAEP